MKYNIRTVQFNTIKKFFIKNYKIFIFIIFGFISTIFIVLYFYTYKNDEIEKNIKNFENIIFQLDNSSKNSIINAKYFVNVSKNIYGVLINIKLAKIAVEKNDILLAEDILLNTLSMVQSSNIKNLIYIKLARIQLVLNKLNLALDNLNRINDISWGSVVENIKGDIYLRKGDIILARTAYSKGMELNGTEIVKEILKLKISSLPT